MTDIDTPTPPLWGKDWYAEVNAARRVARERRRILDFVFPFVRCRSCGWVHVGTPAPQPAGDRCFRCKGLSFEIVDREEFRRTVPLGVTLQGLRWPPINPTADDPIMANPEALTEIATRAFHRATREAIEENDGLGIPSYGGKDGKIIVRQPPKPPIESVRGEAGD